MADKTAQYLTLGLGRETFGIDIRGVREILDMQPVTRLPQAPAFLLGLIDVRGASYPVVDLRAKLGLPPVDATNATRIIIVDVPMFGRSVGIGFVADCVFEVAQLDAGGTEPPRTSAADGSRATSRSSAARTARSSSCSISSG